MKVKIVKNKVAPPFKNTEFDIMYGEGISKVGEILDLGVGFDIVKNLVLGSAMVTRNWDKVETP